MKTIKTLSLILLKGWPSFYGNHSKKIKLVGFVLYTMVVCIIVNIMSLADDKINDILSNLLSALSIFTALAYGILFIGPEKLAERISILENRLLKQKRYFDDADKNSLIRYANFIKSFNQDIFFVSLMSLVIISLIFIKWLIINQIISQCLIAAIVWCSIILLFFLFKIVATLYRLNQASISDANLQIKDFAKTYNPNKVDRGNGYTSDIPKYKDNEYDNQRHKETDSLR